MAVASQGSGGPRRWREPKYFSQEDLKVKYRGRTDRIKAYCKSVVEHDPIAQLQICCQEKDHGIIYIVTEAATQQAMKKAMLYLAGEFYKDGHKKSHSVGTPATPERGKSGPREAARVVHEQIQIQLHSEGERCVPLTVEALRRHDLNTSCELRQFACQPCDNPWWRTVLVCKPVSKCRECSVRYNALDREKEFGIGRFTCTCGNVFYIRCEATDSHRCRGCKSDVSNPYIHPKFKRRPRTSQPHFHPISGHQRVRGPRVINASTPHDSTGSTLSTFLTQWDEMSEYVDLDSGSDSDDSDHDDHDSGSNPRFRDDSRGNNSADSDSSSGGDSDGGGGNGRNSIDKGVGVCSFKCPKCHHTFTVICTLMDTADCYECGEDVKPHSWSPCRQIQRKSNNKHSCSACQGKGCCPNLAKIK